MYEELVKKLRYCGNAVSCLHCPYWEGCGGSKEDLMQAADAIEELSKKRESACWGCKCEKIEQASWIPVTERLPEIGKKVLVFAYGHDVLTARLRKDTENDYPVFECNGIYLEMAKPGRITHWMPLPEPPKEI